MALMTSIRERMTIVLWTLLALFLLSMTVGGLVGGANIVDQLFGNVNPQTTIARINDQDISPDRFNNLVNQQLQNARSTGQILNDFQIQRIRNSAWDSMVQDVLVSQEVKRLNLTASNNEVMWHLENNPPPFLTQNPNFQTDGLFDIVKYRQALANPQGNEWIPIEAFMRETYIPNYKLQKMIDQSIVITSDDVRDEFIIKNIKFTVTAAHITSTKVPKEESEVTQEEIKKRYKATMDNYKHDELRSISYVPWSKKPSKEDSLMTIDLANKLYKRSKSGEDFSELANEYSMDPSNQKTKGGDLGWFGKNRMVKAFEEAAFNAKKNQIVGPVKSNFGYHIIHVRDYKNNEQGEKEVLASHILLKVEASPSTISKLKKEAILFSYDAEDLGFDKAVEESSLTIASYKRFDHSTYNIPSIGGLRPAIRFAFNSKINDISDVIENDNYFVVCRLDGITKPGFKNFDEVKSSIERDLKGEKSKKSAREEANNILIKLTSEGSVLEKIIDQSNDVDGFKNESKTLKEGFPSIGKSDQINGALLNASPGDIIGPLKTNRGYAIVQLIDREEFDSLAFGNQVSKIRNTIYNRKQNQFFQSWIDNLKNDAIITDNRRYYF